MRGGICAKVKEVHPNRSASEVRQTKHGEGLLTTIPELRQNDEAGMPLPDPTPLVAQLENLFEQPVLNSKRLSTQVDCADMGQ